MVGKLIAFMTSKWYSFILVFFVLSTVVLAFLLYNVLGRQPADSNLLGVQTSNCPYKFINQLRCEPDLARKKKEYVSLTNDLSDFIDSEQDKGTLTSGSVYFRDLQNGPTMNINGQENFAPASLLKVPLMVTYYKKAEAEPGILERRFTITGSLKTLPQNIQPGRSAEIGKAYTIDELIKLMVTQSDNIAWQALLTDLRQNYSEEDFVSTLSDLGIIDPRKRSDQQYITVQAYASIFRILYNSSYLDLEMSDKALSVLVQSDFEEGMVAGLPDDTLVAHKFGEQKNGDEQQLHDCGIVYFPENPYIICIMTKGKNVSELTRVIQEVSKMVYEEVERRN